MQLTWDEELFFQITFFKCYALRRPQWNDIEVEVTAGDLCCTFYFDSGLSIGDLKRGTAQKLLIELQNYVEQLREIT